MQRIFLDSGLNRLTEKFERLLRDLPEARREMFEAAGRAVLAQVQHNIGGAGKVQSWQGDFVGSRSGYVAVRALANTYDGKYAVGHVTNAIENGHKTRPAHSSKPRSPGKSRLDRVPGKHFYADAGWRAETVAYKAAERFLQALSEKLEG